MALDPVAYAHLSGHTFAVPELDVLAMGFSWSLYFCRHMVKHGPRAAGIPEDQWSRDRRVAPSLSGQVAAATYVDNAGIVGT